MLRSSWICSNTDNLLNAVKKFYRLTSGLNTHNEWQKDFTFWPDSEQWNQPWIFEYSQSSFFPEFSADILHNAINHAQTCDVCRRKITVFNKRIKDIRQRKNLIKSNIVQQIILNNPQTFIKSPRIVNATDNKSYQNYAEDGKIIKYIDFKEKNQGLLQDQFPEKLTEINNSKNSFDKKYVRNSWKKFSASLGKSLTHKKWEALRYSVATLLIALGLFSNPYYVWQKIEFSKFNFRNQKQISNVLISNNNHWNLSVKDNNLIQADIGFPEINFVFHQLHSFITKQNPENKDNSDSFDSDETSLDLDSIGYLEANVTIMPDNDDYTNPKEDVKSNYPEQSVDDSVRAWLNQWPAPMEKMVYGRYLYLKQMALLFPNDSAILIDLAIFSHILGKKKENYEIISSIMTNDENNDSKNKNFVYIDQDQVQKYLWKRVDEKISYLERSLRINPYDKDKIEELAMIYNGLGYKTLAFHYIRKWRALS